jgi:hypothetical protein
MAWLLIRSHLCAVDQAPEFSDRSVNLDDQRGRCVQVIHDLELDFTTGKVSQSDYDSTKKALSGELGAILREIDEA